VRTANPRPSHHPLVMAKTGETRQMILTFSVRQEGTGSRNGCMGTYYQGECIPSGSVIRKVIPEPETVIRNQNRLPATVRSRPFPCQAGNPGQREPCQEAEYPDPFCSAIPAAVLCPAHQPLYAQSAVGRVPAESVFLQSRRSRLPEYHRHRTSPGSPGRAGARTGAGLAETTIKAPAVYRFPQHCRGEDASAALSMRRSRP